MDGVLLLLVAAALVAGFIDAVVGGGGIITLPALLATGMPPHLAVGTNKVVGTGASSIATFNYARAGLLDAGIAKVGFPLAVIGSIAGAATILRVPGDTLLVLVAVAIVVVAAYVLARPMFGQEDRFKGVTPRLLAAVAAVALCIGFYDGFLGPGTGNFLLFGLVAVTGLPLVRGAAHGRLLNFGSNIGALAYFAVVGNVDWTVGLVMAIGTVTGGYIGSRVGIRWGQAWIRPLFLIVAAGLLVRLLWVVL